MTEQHSNAAREWRDNFGARIFAQANARTENYYEKHDIDGYSVESVQRGVHQTDWMAWVNGNRGVWGCGKTRWDAMQDAIRTATSLNVTPNSKSGE